MGSTINGETIIDEFFEIWETKVRGGQTPGAALAEIEKEQPDLFGFYSIINRRKEGQRP